MGPCRFLELISINSRKESHKDSRKQSHKESRKEIRTRFRKRGRPQGTEENLTGFPWFRGKKIFGELYRS